MSLRLAYLDLVAASDPARPWLDAGLTDARFRSEDPPPGSIVRGPGDLRELHDIVDDLFGVDAFERPTEGATEVRTGRIALARPAVLMSFLETLRPSLEDRGPAFWTWKSAREAVALRLEGVEALTVEATLR